MHDKWMEAALREAKKAYLKKEIPVGCVAVMGGKIIARGHNLRESLDDPTAHAEILCLRRAAKKIGDWRLSRVTLYVTIKPCKMCNAAIREARIKKIAYGHFDGGKILKKFFKARRGARVV